MIGHLHHITFPQLSSISSLYSSAIALRRGGVNLLASRSFHKLSPFGNFKLAKSKFLMRSPTTSSSSSSRPCYESLKSHYSNTVPQSENQPPLPPSKGLSQRLKEFFKKYGKLGLGIYIGMSVLSFSSIYLALRTGVDVKALIERLGLPQSTIWDNAGRVAIAYAIHKVLMPFRIFLTIALTTFIAKRTRFGNNLFNINKNNR